MTTGVDEFARAGLVAVGDADLAGVVPVAGFGVASAVGLGEVVGGAVVGTGAGAAEDGVVAGVTPVVAAGGGLTSK
ncbi:MAG: hypothetical protein ACLPKI_04595 [Streptosporangiaceae bacterium]